MAYAANLYMCGAKEHLFAISQTVEDPTVIKIISYIN